MAYDSDDAVSLEGQPQAAKDALQELLDDKCCIGYFAAVAGGTDDEQPVFVAPRAVTITGISLVFEDAITADGTNYCTVSVINKDNSDGAVGTAHAFDTPTTDDLAAMTPLALTLGSGEVDLDAGDVLALKNVNAGTGLAISRGIVKIAYKARA